jgi:hypothetical protein
MFSIPWRLPFVKNATELVPVFCLVDGQPVKSPETSFPASRMLPSSALSPERRCTLLVFPMAFESQLLGVAAFDYADGVRNYALLRNKITAVLKSIRLHRELVQKTMLHERSVQERLATTKRMEALSVLAWRNARWSSGLRANPTAVPGPEGHRGQRLCAK